MVLDEICHGLSLTPVIGRRGVGEVFAPFEEGPEVSAAALVPLSE